MIFLYEVSLHGFHSPYHNINKVHFLRFFLILRINAHIGVTFRKFGPVLITNRDQTNDIEHQTQQAESKRPSHQKADLQMECGVNSLLWVLYFHEPFMFVFVGYPGILLHMSRNGSVCSIIFRIMLSDRFSSLEEKFFIPLENSKVFF